MHDSLMRTAAALLLVVIAACGESTGPDRHDYTISLASGDRQFGAVGNELPEPLVVKVTNAGEPAEDVKLEWKVVQGSGATVMPVSGGSDSHGMARAHVRLGPSTGVYRIEARLSGATGSPVVFEAEAISPAVVESVSPNPVSAGDTLTIKGRDFVADASRISALFDGVPGTTLSASATELRVIVPPCIPTRQVKLTIAVRTVQSDPRPLDVIGSSAAPIELVAGEVRTFSDPEELACMRLPGGQPGSAYLAVLQNVHSTRGMDLPMQLVGLTDQPPTVASLSLGTFTETQARAEGEDIASEWELKLRRRERTYPIGSTVRRPEPRIRTMAELPSKGHQRTFKVLNKDEKFTTVTAQAKHIGERVIIYQDVNAPSDGFLDADFELFAALFDDPIYSTVTGAFGEPSDMDGNGRVIVLFTPVVNEMTPKGSDGFIAGFFYSIDLYPKATFANSNEAEIFYSVVPDPRAKHGDARTRNQILSAVPPVLAHELQHMIHHHQRREARANTLEDLWLSEALAHAAEDLVADVLEARGRTREALDFRYSNYARAAYYLDNPTAVSLINNEGQGTLAERGGQWLFVKYLSGHFGGPTLLGRLTRTTRTGVSNVEAETGTPWATLFGRWSVAIWADGAPELRGATVDPAYTFTDIDLRSEFARTIGRFPLEPRRYAFTDFYALEWLSVSRPLHLILEADELNPSPLHLSLTRQWGEPFAADDRPQWALLRIR